MSYTRQQLMTFILHALAHASADDKRGLREALGCRCLVWPEPLSADDLDFLRELKVSWGRE